MARDFAHYHAAECMPGWSIANAAIGLVLQSEVKLSHEIKRDNLAFTYHLVAC